MIKGMALAGGAIVALAACGSGNYAPVSTPVYQPSRLEAICVDRYGVRVEPTHCSGGYGSVRDGFTWEYADLNNQFDLPYYGSRVGSGWSTNRPNVTNITIIQPTVTVRPPGGGESVRVPKSTPTPTPKPTPTRNASVQRGGLGVKTTTKRPG